MWFLNFQTSPLFIKRLKFGVQWVHGVTNLSQFCGKWRVSQELLLTVALNVTTLASKI